MQPDDAVSLLKQGSAEIISEAELRQKLALRRPLRIKLGVDPTSPDLHLGHAVILRKLRQFQDLGHQAILIIGDFTSMIGDPSGRSATRPQLSREEVLANAATYREQAFKVLDPARTTLVSNGDWFKPMGFEQVIRLNSMVTLQQMLQREDFRERIDRQQPIHAHEIQYPIMQGWDSVMVEADVELGGTDQLFNILVGRDLQKQQGQPQQVVFVLPILEGLDGSKKMSKSLGNYIGINETPAEIFGKLMSISDGLMARYYQLLLGQPLDPKANPLEAKKHLASAMVETYHSPELARRTLEEWNLRFSEKRLRDSELPEFHFVPEEHGRDALSIGWSAFAFLKQSKTRSDVRRLIEQGSIQVDGQKIQDPKTALDLKVGQVLRLDKTHAVRIG
jgi:tyrosyl-tRNA synthetase